MALFVFPLALPHDGKTVSPRGYRGLTAFALLSLAVSECPLSLSTPLRPCAPVMSGMVAYAKLLIMQSTRIQCPLTVTNQR